MLGAWTSLFSEALLRAHIVTLCRHCNRPIDEEDGYWVDLNADGDDRIWRETCDANDTFDARHEPEEKPCRTGRA